MWYAIYSVATGALVSTGTVIADPLPEGLGIIELGALPPFGEWNPATHAFDAVPVERIFAPQDFMGRFTIEEETAIRSRAMTDPNMVTFLARVERARSVDPDHPDTIKGMNYCISLGYVSVERAEVIRHG